MARTNRFYKVTYVEGKRSYPIGIVAPNLEALVFVLTKDALIPESAIRKIEVVINGYVIYKGEEFEYSANLSMGESRMPDDVEIDTITDEGVILLETYYDKILKKCLDDAYRQFRG